MQKTAELFDQRNEKKKEIEFGIKSKLDIKVGDFYRYEEGINVGNEISKDGKFIRPCLVLQNNLGNGLLLVLLSDKGATISLIKVIIKKFNKLIGF